MIGIRVLDLINMKGYVHANSHIEEKCDG